VKNGRRFVQRTKCLRSLETALEILPVPADSNHRTPASRLPVFEGDACAGALEERLGDEDAQAEPSAGFAAEVQLPPARARDIGLADPIHDLRGETRAIVRDRDGHLVRIPSCRHLHALARKIDCIFEEIAEPIKEAGVAPPYRLPAIARERHFDCDAE